MTEDEVKGLAEYLKSHDVPFNDRRVLKETSERGSIEGLISLLEEVKELEQTVIGNLIESWYESSEI